MDLKTSASCVAITMALSCGGQALAQDRAPAAAGQPRALEEVVVTARKVAENLQNVPVAVRPSVRATSSTQTDCCTKLARAVR